jgi:cell division protein FtsL
MMSEKTELLEEYDNLIKVKQKLDFNYFLYMLLVITFIAMFAFPKIYINQQIYYTSRDIAKLQVEYETLQEENKLIRTSVESIKFKNQVLDTMF